MKCLIRNDFPLNMIIYSVLTKKIDILMSWKFYPEYYLSNENNEENLCSKKFLLS